MSQGQSTAVEPAVLFARSDSVYKQLVGDVFDIDRDARTWTGGRPVVCHPPCRGWGRLRGLAKPRPDEKALAIFAVECIRRDGGVLEHPAWSSLWATAGLPRPGKGRDEFGGWTLPIAQGDFGHRARKETWLYIVGVEPDQIPTMPLRLGEATHVIAQQRSLRDGTRRTKGTPGWRPECSKAEREHTPEQLAQWLVDLARSVRHG